MCYVLQIDAFLRSKLRADASRALKEAVPRFYGLAFDNDGKLDRAKADALIPSMPRSFCLCTVAHSTQIGSTLKMSNFHLQKVDLQNRTCSASLWLWCPAEIAHIQGNFDNSRFADLLKDTFPKPLDAPAAPPRVGRGGAGPPITWLGPGQVAFALALVSCCTLTHTKLSHIKLRVPFISLQTRDAIAAAGLY